MVISQERVTDGVQTNSCCALWEYIHSMGLYQIRWVWNESVVTRVITRGQGRKMLQAPGAGRAGEGGWGWDTRNISILYNSCPGGEGMFSENALWVTENTAFNSPPLMKPKLEKQPRRKLQNIEADFFFLILWPHLCIWKFHSNRSNYSGILKPLNHSRNYKNMCYILSCG